VSSQMPSRGLVTRIVSTIVIAAVCAGAGVLFIQASPLPYLKGVAVPFSILVGTGIAIYAVWLNPRNKPPV
jgi:hypothetical protein